MINLEELHRIFASISSSNSSTYSDIFATGCYLHKIGKQDAGVKLIRDVLARVNRISNQDHSEIFEQVIINLAGNEKKFALSVPLRTEFRALFHTND